MIYSLQNIVINEEEEHGGGINVDFKDAKLSDSESDEGYEDPSEEEEEEEGDEEDEEEEEEEEEEK